MAGFFSIREVKAGKSRQKDYLGRVWCGRARTITGLEGLRKFGVGFSIFRDVKTRTQEAGFLWIREVEAGKWSQVDYLGWVWCGGGGTIIV